jgi:hypothetical protein
MSAGRCAPKTGRLAFENQSDKAQRGEKPKNSPQDLALMVCLQAILGRDIPAQSLATFSAQTASKRLAFVGGGAFSLHHLDHSGVFCHQGFRPLDEVSAPA